MDELKFKQEVWKLAYINMTLGNHKRRNYAEKVKIIDNIFYIYHPTFVSLYVPEWKFEETLLHSITEILKEQNISFENFLSELQIINTYIGLKHA